MIAIPLTPKKYSLKFKNTVFGYLQVLKELLVGTNDWNNFLIELEALIDEYQNDIELYRIGFPYNWKSLLN